MTELIEMEYQLTNSDVFFILFKVIVLSMFCSVLVAVIIKKVYGLNI